MPNAEPPALITMGVSHFCEKARWALQRYGLEFVEEVHVPGAHRFAAKATGGGGSVPCLRLPQAGSWSGGSRPALRCIDGSTSILQWVDAQRAAAAGAAEAGAASCPQQQARPPLFPGGDRGAEVERLCAEFDERLGPAVRVWAYSHLLRSSAIARAVAAPPVPALERALLRCGGWLVLRALMAKGMGINAQNGEAALRQVRQVFDQVGDLLADGRSYLAGEGFTAADLTFAALAAAAIGQAYAAAPGLDAGTPAAMRVEIEDLQAHPAGQFALQLWRTQRGAVV